MGKNNYFKTWSLRKWLLQNNQEYIKLYSGSDAHKRSSEKIENIKKRVEAALEDLIRLELCSSRVTTAEKNLGTTIEYALGYFGRLVALLIESTKVENIHMKKFVYDQIYDSIALPQYSTDFSSRSKFTSLYMEKVKNNGLFSIFVEHYRKTLFSNAGVGNLDQFRGMLLILPFENVEISQLWALQKEALYELYNTDKHKCTLLFFDIKLDIERTQAKTCHDFSKYEEMRFKLKHDPVIVTLETCCTVCQCFVIGGFNLALYLERIIGVSTCEICPCINCGRGFLELS